MKWLDCWNWPNLWAQDHRSSLGTLVAIDTAILLFCLVINNRIYWRDTIKIRWMDTAPENENVEKNCCWKHWSKWNQIIGTLYFFENAKRRKKNLYDINRWRFRGDWLNGERRSEEPSAAWRVEPDNAGLLTSAAGFWLLGLSAELLCYCASCQKVYPPNSHPLFVCVCMCVCVYCVYIYIFVCIHVLQLSVVPLFLSRMRWGVGGAVCGSNGKRQSSSKSNGYWLS